MNRLLRLDNPLQAYAWGSRTALPALLGWPGPADRPLAEMWLGAHPAAPSRVGDTTLLELIRRDPAAMLGAATAARYGGALPFLLKLLAAAAPLSLQAHPNLEQARAGFARENTAGIPLAAPRRNYRDANHKPEIICALTEFWALNSFRPVPASLQLWRDLGVTTLAAELAALARSPDRDGLRQFFRTLLELPGDRRAAVTAELATRAAARRCERPEFEWVARLAAAYPGDVGTAAPLLLNLLRLAPGEATYCAAGELHAYLEGCGVELMANSDNVLRGGCTPKHVDVPELLRVLTFAAHDARLVRPERRSATEQVYRTPAPEFELSLIEVAPGRAWRSPGGRSLEIVVCVAGTATAAAPDGGGGAALAGGQALAVPAAVPYYELTGQARLFRAAPGPATGESADA